MGPRAAPPHPLASRDAPDQRQRIFDRLMFAVIRRHEKADQENG